MRTIIKNENGITVKELKEFIKDWPEVDDNGDPYEVWFQTGRGLSSVCTEVCKLNGGDIHIGRE
jgi:hypothetical protein